MLSKTAIAYLAVAEYPLDVLEGMPDLGSSADFEFLGFQLVGSYNIQHVGSDDINVINQTQSGVDTHVHLHAKLLFVAPFGLIRLRIALAGSSSGGAGSRDNGGIYDSTLTQHQTVFLDPFAHLFKRILIKTVLLQEMPQVENGDLVRQVFQFDTGEVPHGFDVIQSVFQGRIAQVIRQLQAVNSQNHRQKIGKSSILALGVMTGCLLL